jgi:hypothetical protein
MFTTRGRPGSHLLCIAEGSAVSWPIEPKEYGLERRKELMAEVRRAIAGGLGQEP